MSDDRTWPQCSAWPVPESIYRPSHWRSNRRLADRPAAHRVLGEETLTLISTSHRSVGRRRHQTRPRPLRPAPPERIAARCTLRHRPRSLRRHGTFFMMLRTRPWSRSPSPPHALPDTDLRPVRRCTRRCPWHRARIDLRSSFRTDGRQSSPLPRPRTRRRSDPSACCRFARMPRRCAARAARPAHQRARRGGCLDPLEQSRAGRLRRVRERHGPSAMATRTGRAATRTGAARCSSPPSSHRRHTGIHRGRIA
jgi:hypothetical protein